MLNSNARERLGGVLGLGKGGRRGKRGGGECEVEGMGLGCGVLSFLGCA